MSMKTSSDWEMPINGTLEMLSGLLVVGCCGGGEPSRYVGGG